MKALGDYINGAFVEPRGEPLVSRNPARAGQVVLDTAHDPARVGAACDAAAAAQRAWAERSPADRWDALVRFRDALRAAADSLADAIVAETGKLRSEARGEAGSLVSRFDLVRAAAASELGEGPLPGRPHEILRFHPLGVVGVIGPFNYPLHLCHAHVVPALLLGNTVVVKPSDVAPLSAQRYAEAAHAAGLPPGVLNVVQGGAKSGAALLAHRAVRGLCFTGSYAVGRVITEQALDRPELLVALEMGGKNTVVVLDDASVRQAAHEIAVGGYLTTGQRCTATDRVLVHRALAGPLIDALRPLVGSLRFGDPDDPASFAGPLTTQAGRDRLEAMLARARDGGAEPLVAGGREPDGWFVKASLHRLPDGVHDIPGYTDTELFGPDVHVEVIEDDDEAVAVLEASPYGFANAVFTASPERFEALYRRTHAGIVNRNRSTNMASPLLPFGGMGKSGNYRPAGAWAVRNVVAPVAVQENVLGTIQAHPALADKLPPPNLGRLAAQHAAEEAREAARTVLDVPRPMAMQLPAGGRLPASDAWLIRLYAGERVVREKKPLVFDHLRSSGPWMVSVDDEPLSVLDGMSQTATLCGGFAEDAVVRGFVEGAFDGALLSCDDTAVRQTSAAAAGAEGEGEDPASAMATVLRHLVPGLPHVTFANSGAEANEKALALCRLDAVRRAERAASERGDDSASVRVPDKILAFEGSFHGRTLLALHATYNPAKRQPFEIPGHECAFAPFPVWQAPGDEPAAPAGFYAACGRGDAGELEARFGNADEDPLLAAEVASLSAVHAALASGRYYACIVEPMQSEGGDRYATARFFRALRLLTRHHGVPLVFDEVQTGFGLGGPFAWHTRFQLVNFRGQPDYPDAVTFAKRAQVGVVMSRFEDPELTSAHPASLVRGRIHAEMMSTSHGAERIEKLVKPRLAAIARAFPHLALSPRACGYAFAFDVPTPQHMAAYLGQRFWRGAVVFGAGSRTVRYRLSDSFLAREVEQLFDTVRRSLSWLDAHPGATPPAWEDIPRLAADRPPLEHRIREVDADEGLACLPAILDIEYQVYEPARRTPPAQIRAALTHPEGISILAEVPHGDGWQLVGFSLGSPLEAHVEVEGPDRDPMLGRENSLYSVSVTVADEFQGRGLGRALKEAQLRAARARTRADGTPRYRFVTGRNRVGHTASMTHLNRAYGAHVSCVLTGQYEDPEGQAIYYRIPLGAIAPEPAPDPAPDPAPESTAMSESRTQTGAGSQQRPERSDRSERIDRVDLATGLARVLDVPPPSLRAALAGGLLSGPAINKITIMNYTTPGVVRALEWVGALAPELPHIYLTSCRDECVDKSLRALRWHRKQAVVAIGLEGGYVGHTTGAARSLSDPGVHRQGPPEFAWPRVPHPADAGVDATVSAIRTAVAAAGGPERVFGLFYEICQERTGRVIPDAFWPALAALRRELELPAVAVETASASYRSGRGPFAGTGAPFVPDIMVWWSGGQTGYMHVASRWFVPTPLTMVSTWDGDELSLVRLHHQLRAARTLDLAPAIAALDEAMAVAGRAGLVARGLGLYRVIECASASDRGGTGASVRVSDICERLAARGVHVRALPGDRIAIAPTLDGAERGARALAAALAEVL